MKIAAGFLVLFLLAACSDSDEPPPDPTICDDWRMMAFIYEGTDSLWNMRYFMGPYVKRVCVISETPTEPPK